MTFFRARTVPLLRSLPIFQRSRYSEAKDRSAVCYPSSGRVILSNKAEHRARADDQQAPQFAVTWPTDPARRFLPPLLRAIGMCQTEAANFRRERDSRFVCAGCDGTGGDRG